MDKIWDPLRHKEVKLTPEERVRQWFIVILRDHMGVPEHQMMSEVDLRLIGQAASKVYRADIIIYGHGGKPLAVVECKRPEVQLSAAVIEQAQRYNASLGVSYLFITNGTTTYCFKQSGSDTWQALQTLPSYSSMLPESI